MTELLGKARIFGNMLGKGLLTQNAPGIAGGFVAVAMKKVTIGQITDLVNNKGDLWDILSPEHKKGIKQLGAKVGNVDWLTTEWFLGSIKKDAPAVTSLFLGWPKARNWLDKQIILIKTEIGK